MSSGPNDRDLYEMLQRERLAREKAERRNELLTDYYECKMQPGERASEMEVAITTLEAELAAERARWAELRAAVEERKRFAAEAPCDWCVDEHQAILDHMDRLSTPADALCKALGVEES